MNTFQTSTALRWYALVMLIAPLAVVRAQPQMEDRPVTEIRIVGLDRVPEQLVRNAIRLNAGDPYNADVVQDDTVRITHLGKFATVTARVDQNEQGGLVVTYVVEELPLISDVQVVGNKILTDQELLNLIRLRPGDAVDPYHVDQAADRIRAAYEEEGYFLTDVLVDRAQLDETGILIFRVREGPMVRIQEIDIEGNEAFSDRELRSKIQSNTHLLFLRSGALSREQLDQDAARLRDYYRERGYLDAQVARQIDISENQKDARVVFRIDEGRMYFVDTLRVEGAQVVTDQQVLESIPLKAGDIFSQDRVRNSREAIDDLYGKIGFIETRIEIERLFHDTEPRVDVVVRIDEGKPYVVGNVEVRGNALTKSKVILRQVRGMEPGRRFDGTGVDKTKQRLRESPLFADAELTVLGDADDEVRDVLVEVEERNTGSLSFGAGVSSDAGVIGAIDLRQRNFDIADPPESFNEFITGKAFRGAGQYFAVSLAPGDEVSNYSVTFREPYLFDSEYLFDSNAFYFDRDRDDYDEQRYGGSFGLGQRFGDVWSASVNVRAENIEIDDIERDAPMDVFNVAGDSTLTSLGLIVRRSTTDSRIFPTTGSETSFGIARAGAMGGDFDFTKATFSYNKYWTVAEDFLGRHTVFSVRSDLGYIFEDDEAPIFERFFAGGHRTMRGFDFRGVGPVGLARNGRVTDESIGGDWLFLLGFEYNFPVYREVLRVVLFTDTGTVTDDLSFDDYRITVGAGLRLQVPGLAQVPFAFDFAVPIAKEDEDDTRVFSFDIALPF